MTKVILQSSNDKRGFGLHVCHSRAALTKCHAVIAVIWLQNCRFSCQSSQFAMHGMDDRPAWLPQHPSTSTRPELLHTFLHLLRPPRKRSVKALPTHALESLKLFDAFDSIWVLGTHVRPAHSNGGILTCPCGSGYDTRSPPPRGAGMRS